MEQATATERVDLRVLCGLSLGEAQAQAGRLEEAHALTERTLALVREHQEQGHQAYALRLLGDIAAQRDPPDVELAEAHYRQALALADKLGMRPLQATATSVSAPCTAGWDEHSRRILPWARPSNCTGLWR